MEMTAIRPILLSLGIALVLLLAGCGGGAPSDSTVAHCLQVALNSEVQGTPLANGCSPMVMTKDPVTVQCSHQTGNEFQCIATDKNGNATDYEVTDDGKNLSWQAIL